jgi:hypothetical protein
LERGLSGLFTKKDTAINPDDDGYARSNTLQQSLLRKSTQGSGYDGNMPSPDDEKAPG